MSSTPSLASYQAGFYAPGRGGTPKYPELWRGCVGAWNPGLGNSGLALRDWSGNGKHGTLTNGPTWVNSNGITLSFDGVNDYVEITESSLWDFGTGDFAFSMWIYLRSLINLYDGLLSTHSYLGGSGWRLKFQVSPNVIYLGGGGSDEAVISTPTSLIGVWHHLGLSRKGTSVIGYVDGFIRGETTRGGDFASGGNPLSIGRNTISADSFPFEGFIDDVRIYRKSLTSQEIRQLASSRGIPYELAPRKAYSLPSPSSTRQYKLFRPSILRGA